MSPQAMDSTWFIPPQHLDMQPPLGKTLGKQRIHLIYLSFILLLVPDVQCLENICFVYFVYFVDVWVRG